MITLNDIPSNYKNATGRHKGKLNQEVLQCKGNFLFRDPHPTVEGLYFLAFNKAQKFPQRWAPESAMPKALGVKPPEGVPEEFVIMCNRGKQGAKIGTLDQDTLQIEGEFSKGDKHPQCKLIVFHGYRENGRQRWQTLQQYKESLEYAKDHQKNARANRTPEQIEEDKIKQKARYEKFWSDPEKAEAERAKRREKRTNMTEEEREVERAYNRQKAKENPERKKESARRDYEKNREHYIAKSTLWNKENKKRRNKSNREIKKAEREQNTIALNEFYRSNKVPKYLWHKEEFAVEKDLQKALEHILVKRYGLNIVHEMHTQKGRPDIYIKELDLIVEVKLTSDLWNIEKVAKQKARYEKVAETIVVSLDGEPEGWKTPKQLFKMIKSRI